MHVIIEIIENIQYSIFHFTELRFLYSLKKLFLSFSYCFIESQMNLKYIITTQITETDPENQTHFLKSYKLFIYGNYFQKHLHTTIIKILITSHQVRISNRLKSQI